MYELSDSTLKQLSKTNKDSFSSEKIAAFGLAIVGVTTIALSKTYSYVGYTALDGVLTKSVPYTQFSGSYLLGVCLYIPFWYASASYLFVSAKESIALQKYNPNIKDSQNENEQTILRQALWNIHVIANKLSFDNSLVTLVTSPSLVMINVATATSLGAKLKGIDNETAAEMAILGAASACLCSTVTTSLNLAIRYRLTGNKPTLFPAIGANDEVRDSDIEPGQEAISLNDKVHDDETVLEVFIRRSSTEQGPLIALMWENAKRDHSQLAVMVEQHNASIDTRTDMPSLTNTG